MSLRPDLYPPIIEAPTVDGCGPRLIGDLAANPTLATLPPGALIEGLAVLIGAGRAHPAQSETDRAAAAPRCRALNAALIERARLGGEITWLSSPVIGGGVQVGRFEQMFLGPRARGVKTAAGWAAHAWRTLSKEGQAATHGGVASQLNRAAPPVASGRDCPSTPSGVIRQTARGFEHSHREPFRGLGKLDIPQIYCNMRYGRACVAAVEQSGRRQ